MKKRVLSILLAMVLMVGLLPVKAEAASAKMLDETKAIVFATITEYAKAVYRPDADDEAFKDFFKHGFFGNGKDMVLTENSSMVSAMFNAYVFQEAVTMAITEGIMTMQHRQETIMTLCGGPGWHNFYYDYHYQGYFGDLENKGASIGTVVSDERIYGANHYSGPVNENDEVMELLAGGLTCDIVIKQKSVRESTIVYDLDFYISDNFSFSGDYSDIADKGYNTSTDDKLNNLGHLMTYVGLSEFDWMFSKTMTIETPLSCDHVFHDYFWTQGECVDQLIIDKSMGGSVNNAVLNTYESANGSQRYCYLFDESIRLFHDRPWVMEYSIIPNISYIMGSAFGIDSRLSVVQASKNYSWLLNMSFIQNEGEEQDNELLTALKEYAGVELTGKFNFQSKHTYYARLENMIDDDGGNMIYITVHDETTDEDVLGPVPMTDHWHLIPNVSGHIPQDEKAEYISGEDIIINCLYEASGNDLKKVPEIRIWENGKDGSGEDTFDASAKTPTCTKQGGTVHTCRDCGYSYMTDTVPATGHSFGEYVYDNNSSCTEDGTQTRSCAVCGVTESITASETALGHEYQSVVTAPTLTAEGYTTYTCTRCGDSYKDDFVAKKEHTYVGVVTEPTCTEQGYTTYTCSECGDSYVDDYTGMIEHTPVIDPAVEPTCVEKGKTEGSHCGVCGFVIKKQANISTVNRHDFEEEITKIPTYDEDGEVTYTCKDCGKTEVKTIPAFEKPAPKNPFTDVSEGDWFYGPVIWALKEGVTGGKTETTFAPNEGCTRAQVVTFLWAANGKPEPESMDNPFNDVADDAWYLKPVLWAVEQGITGGVAEGMFGPEQTCTRAQIATFLWAANGKHGVTSGSTFSDVTGAEWYATPVIWAVENDVTSGIGNGKFGPNDTCTRAQVVTFLYKVYGNK